jgi:hypothetical protein
MTSAIRPMWLHTFTIPPIVASRAGTYTPRFRSTKASAPLEPAIPGFRER